MLPKELRLTTGEMKAVFGSGTDTSGEHVIVKRADSEKTKFGVAISRKLPYSTVQNNYVKRKVYSAIERILKEETIDGSTIIIVKKDISSTPFEILQREINELLLKAQ